MTSLTFVENPTEWYKHLDNGARALLFSTSAGAVVGLFMVLIMGGLLRVLGIFILLISLMGLGYFFSQNWEVDIPTVTQTPDPDPVTKTQKVGEVCSSEKLCVDGASCEDSRCYENCKDVTFYVFGPSSDLQKVVIPHSTIQHKNTYYCDYPTRAPNACPIETPNVYGDGRYCSAGVPNAYGPQSTGTIDFGFMGDPESAHVACPEGSGCVSQLGAPCITASLGGVSDVEYQFRIRNLTEPAFQKLKDDGKEEEAIALYDLINSAYMDLAVIKTPSLKSALYFGVFVPGDTTIIDPSDTTMAFYWTGTAWIRAPFETGLSQSANIETTKIYIPAAAQAAQKAMIKKYRC